MNGTTARRLLLALAGVFALDLRAEPAWTTADVEPASWTALSGNLLDGLAGTRSGSVSPGYRIAFGNVGALASYCAEIEAAGRAALPKGTAVISVR